MRSTVLWGVTLWCFVSPVNSAEVCSFLSKSKDSVAYLLDREKNISAGPVDLGDVPLSANVDDEGFKIDTKYYIIAAPKSIFIRNPWAGMGYGVDLIPLRPSFCKNGLTYKVILNWVRRKGEVRPYKFDAPFPDFSIPDDLGYEENISDLYKFRALVIGRMVAPKDNGVKK